MPLILDGIVAKPTVIRPIAYGTNTPLTSLAAGWDRK